MNAMRPLFNLVLLLATVRPLQFLGLVVTSLVLLWVIISLLTNDGLLQWVWKPIIGFYAAALMSGFFQAWKNGA